MSVDFFPSVTHGYRNTSEIQPTLITDERLGLVDFGQPGATTAQFATAEPKGQRVITLHFNSREEFDRVEPVIVRCLSLLQLKAGWDSYGARAPRISLFEAGLQLITRLVAEGAPTPHVVPTNRGGFQFEWNLAGRELEIEIFGATRFGVVYEDEASDYTFDEVVGGVGPILELVAKLLADK